ncbi:Maf family protein [Halanaerobacter jeridensis]|uniref:dTTP/UTP pyrophosphatase n=1 Tax=Halanaerobacter jeridensis TaxID=706427 RepID=A0A939BQD5_9FIRM|nr:Maf family protein [Halanaerobacter jeridensis]MBM7556179.1 septum formation protein [Halanaerobacter jeridensis]
MEIILASGSPRRKMLLEQLGLDFKVQPSNLDESKVEFTEPSELVQRLSYLKANEVQSDQSQIIIAADTVVSYQDRILEKPASKEEAKQMLKTLSGTTHQVLTGITVIAGEIVNTDYETTNVTFKELTEKEINDYIATGEPFDKAGGYGIQSKGAVFVKGIEGCFYNVMGLSLYKLLQMIKGIGLEIELDG